MTLFYIAAAMTALGSLLAQAQEGTALETSGWALMLGGIGVMLVVVLIP